MGLVLRCDGLVEVEFLCFSVGVKLDLFFFNEKFEVMF